MIIAMTPVLMLGVSRSLRTALWSPLLEAECVRLLLVDEAACECIRRDLAAARTEQRLPSARQVSFVLFTALIAGPCGTVLVAFLVILTGVMLAAPWLVSLASHQRRGVAHRYTP